MAFFLELLHLGICPCPPQGMQKDHVTLCMRKGYIKYKICILIGFFFTALIDFQKSLHSAYKLC